MAMMSSSSCSWLILILVATLYRPAHSLGGFSSHRARFGPGRWGYPPPSSRNLILEEVVADSDCVGRSCASAKDCCASMVCVDVGVQEPGRCRWQRGAGLGQPCESGDDCQASLLCAGPDDKEVLMKSCRNRSSEGAFSKHYNEDCDTSEECMVQKGQCCQFVRRHRSRPRKACAYFTDERQCIGVVDQSLLVAAIADNDRL